VISLLLQKKQFLLYCLIGASGATLDTATYFLLVKTELLDFQIANVVSTSLGALLSFLLNAHYNFRVTNKIGRRLAVFLGIAFLGLLLSAGILYVLVDLHHFNKYLSKMVTLPFVVLLQYNLNRLISFRKTA
jgi:putative flippase GtrA